MLKRVLSVFLALIMLLSATSVLAQDVSEGITVYLCVSQYGEIVKDKHGNEMAYVGIELGGKTEYSLDDVFKEAHINHYEGGIDGYASSVGEWGFGVDKFWGDTSYNFGYQVNGGIESVSGPGHIVNDGDYVDVCIYKNLYPDTESYSKFDSTSKNILCGEEITLTLSAVSGYDENWANIFSSCEGATITINDEETLYTTNENGEVTILFETEGNYIISAKKEKILNDETRPAITAPFCVVKVNERPEIKIIHNIAAGYSQMNLEDAAGNLPWIVADMAVYEELYPSSDYVFSSDKKQEALELIVDAATTATSAGDLAKYSLALRAMGYDAKNIYTKEFEKDDIIAKLVSLVENRDESVTNIYTLPYVIIALSQADDYASNEQMEYLISTAIESKTSWQDTEFGTDALTPMVLALSPYYNMREDIKEIIDEAVIILKENQRVDGLIDGFVGYESASTGLAICALSAVGIDSKEIKKAKNSLIDGLILTATEQMDGFPNAFATEQGFRGLLAWKYIAEGIDKAMYDFKDKDMDEANVSGCMLCPVVFDVVPQTAIVKADGVGKIAHNCFDLGEGVYTFSISAGGYASATYTVEISAVDVLNRAPKNITLFLNKTSGGGGGSGISDKKEEQKEEVKKENEENEEKTQEEVKTETEKSIFNENTFVDVKAENWYFPAVKYVYENNLFKGTDKGFEPEAPMTRAMLVTVLYRLDNCPDNTGTNSFDDVNDDLWYAEGVKWAAQNKIVNGVSDTNFAPEDKITREQVLTILFRYAVSKGYSVPTQKESDISLFEDYKDISSYAAEAINYMLSSGIIRGRDDNKIAPANDITRAEFAMILTRFAEVEK